MKLGNSARKLSIDSREGKFRIDSDFLIFEIPSYLYTIVRFGHKITTIQIFNTNTFVLIDCTNNKSEIRRIITHNNLYRELISRSCQRYCGVSLNLNRMYMFLTERNFWHSNECITDYLLIFINTFI